MRNSKMLDAEPQRTCGNKSRGIVLCAGEDKAWKKGKDPHPQDEIQHLLTLPRTPGRFPTRPLPVHFTTKMSVVRPFSVLRKDEIGP